MFNKEMTESIIDDCLLRMSLFGEKYKSSAQRDKFIRICISGVDGGGLSTYGKSAIIGADDHYECHENYLYIHRTYRRDATRGRRTEYESVTFIPYENIVAIECAPCAYV